MRWLLIMALACAPRESQEQSESVDEAAEPELQPRLVALHCGNGGQPSDWRFSARLEEVRAEVASDYGTWLACERTVVTDDCRQRFDADCLRRVGADNDVDYGLRVRGELGGSQGGHWTVWLYDLRSGQLHQRDALDCAYPCTEGRAESSYRDVLRRVFATTSR